MVKVRRSIPAPESLAEEARKKTGRYDKPDVIERLKKDFHNKCYICEMKELQDPNVEHLLPHKNGKYPERKFDWENLFWSCAYCNSVKNFEDELQRRTASLTEEVFSLKNTGMRTYTSDMRLKLLQKEMNVLYRQLEKIHNNPESKIAGRTIRSLLRRESAFAAFKRCYVREHAAEYPELQQYVEIES